MSCRLRSPATRKARRSSKPVMFGQQLYEWRKKNDFSQSEAALQLGISTRTLQEWEQGRARPRHLALNAVEALIKSEVERFLSVYVNHIYACSQAERSDVAVQRRSRSTKPSAALR